jgi:hypothetical protein
VRISRLKFIIPIGLGIIIALTIAIIFMSLTMLNSSKEDPCTDARTFAEYQSCQTINRILEECEQFKGTELEAQCVADHLR